MILIKKKKKKKVIKYLGIQLSAVYNTWFPVPNLCCFPLPLHGTRSDSGALETGSVYVSELAKFPVASDHEFSRLCWLESLL